MRKSKTPSFTRPTSSNSIASSRKVALVCVNVSQMILNAGVLNNSTENRVHEVVAEVDARVEVLADKFQLTGVPVDGVGEISEVSKKRIGGSVCLVC